MFLIWLCWLNKNRSQDNSKGKKNITMGNKFWLPNLLSKINFAFYTDPFSI